jgi:hypothetical protein
MDNSFPDPFTLEAGEEDGGARSGVRSEVTPESLEAVREREARLSQTAEVEEEDEAR